MKDYLLFIDTEATGLPKKWWLPYNVPGNWPNAVQVSWLVYTKQGEKIKEQNHYISNSDMQVSESAFRIHGLDKKFLQQNGILRKQVLALLSADLHQYQPLIVGHFIELDYHVTGAAYFREAMENPMENLSTFCIMKAARHLQQNPQYRFLRLGGLYELLFKKPLLHQHNALVDASATADCFFELVKRNEIKSFQQPLIVFQKKLRVAGLASGIIVTLLILLTALLIACYYG